MLKTNSTKSSILVFEFASCCGLENEDIALEGYAMYCTLMRDCYESNKFAKSFFLTKPNLTLLKPPEYFKIENWISFVDFLSLNGHVSKDCIDVFKTYSENTEYTILVAPEDDQTLLKFTKVIKNKNLGCDAKIVKVTSDKWSTYKKLKKRINVPKTSLKPEFDRFILKPRSSCGGNDVKLVENLNFPKKLPEGYIAQEYIPGRSLSVSIIAGDNIVPISVNEQILKNFSYKGSIVPAQKITKCELKSVTELAVEAASTLKVFGYCGIDVVLGEQAYVVDVNPRLTTSSVLFKYVYGVNLVDLLIKNYEKGLKDLPKWSGKKGMIIKNSEIKLFFY